MNTSISLHNIVEIKTELVRVTTKQSRYPDGYFFTRHMTFVDDQGSETTISIHAASNSAKEVKKQLALITS